MNIEQLHEANQEIERLKSQLKLMCSQHDKEIQAIDDTNDSVLDLKQGTVDELRSMVGALKCKALEVITSNSSNTGYEPSISVFQRDITELYNLHQAMPEQCLATIKAQSITDAIFNSEQINLEDDNNFGKYVCLEDLEVNIKQLLEAKS